MISLPTAKIRNLLLTGALAVTGSVVAVGAAPAAQAAPGAVSVYVSMPTWLNNCPRGGSVKHLNVSTWGNYSDNRSDSGDDMVYIRTDYNRSTTVVAQGLCYNGRNTYWGPAVSQSIKATRNGQTFWIGPAGVRSN